MKVPERIVGLISLIVLALLFSLQVNAQDQPAYRLREPSAAEYLHQILGMPLEDDQGKGFLPITTPLDRLLPLRYPDLYLEDFDTLLAVYEYFSASKGMFFYSREQWGKLLIRSWLRQNPTDLSQIQHLEFADFYIDVYPRDFDSDGKNEYLLDIAKGQKVDRQNCNLPAEYVDYLLVRQEGSEYRFIDTPLPWVGSWHQPGIQELDFRDINADGQPEWILVDGGYSIGGMGMGYANLGQLYIISWRNGTLVELTPPFDSNNWNFDETLNYEETEGGGCLTMPHSVTWQFLNIDSDEALEILQHQDYEDNWLCDSRTTKSFDWDTQTDQYVFLKIERTFADTQNCAQRQAEEMMWRGNYENAIREYELALMLPQYVSNFENTPEVMAQHQTYRERGLHTLNQYMRGRLALAYILMKQPSEADMLLRELISENFTSESIKHFVEELSIHLDNPLLACAAAYTVFTEYIPEQVLGVTVELEIEDEEYLPEHIGCDAPTLIREALEVHKFDTQTTPVEQLTAMGLPVATSLQADFDRDGNNEWLVWLQAPIPPIFFANQEAGYIASRPLIDPYRQSKGVTTWHLPDGETSLVYLNFETFGDRPSWYRAYDWIRGTGAPPICELEDNRTTVAGFISMWRMKGNTLDEFFSTAICESDLDRIFPGGEASQALVGNDPEWPNYPIADPITYYWDDRLNTYNLPPAATPTLIPEETESFSYSSFNNAMAKKDFPAIVEMTNNLPAGLNLEYHFYRALALEALNRPDGALAEYVAILEADPDSAWGMLAALHVEKEA